MELIKSLFMLFLFAFVLGFIYELILLPFTIRKTLDILKEILKELKERWYYENNWLINKQNFKRWSD